eukprot:TRINITY_DN5326_c0_g1_i1.p1 TRINITY_DN5326_c0_g1~~TRINITY_DN5326_c0_g1_i1.p1  ORF type:complete len:427 (-),score=37.76 TRINITY_DN5326_c0_g1_i1:313-1593(-)
MYILLYSCMVSPQREEERKKNMNVVDIIGGNSYPRSLFSSRSSTIQSNVHPGSVSSRPRINTSEITDTYELIENEKASILLTRQNPTELRRIADFLICFAVRKTPNSIVVDATTDKLAHDKLEYTRSGAEIFEVDRSTLLSLDSEPRLQRFLRLNGPNANPSKIFQMKELFKRTAANARCVLVLIPDSEYTESITRAVILNAGKLKKDPSAKPVTYILLAEKNPDQLEMTVKSMSQPLPKEMIQFYRNNKRYIYSRPGRFGRERLNAAFNSMFNTLEERGIKEFFYILNQADAPKVAVYDFESMSFQDFLQDREVLNQTATTNVLGNEMVGWLQKHRPLVEDCLLLSFEYNNGANGALQGDFRIVKMNLETMREVQFKYGGVEIKYQGEMFKEEDESNTPNQVPLIPVNSEGVKDYESTFLRGLIQ